MYHKLKQPNAFWLAILASFIMDGCHSSKKATKSSSVDTYPQANYMPASEKPPINNTSTKPKKKNSTSANNTASREGVIVDTYSGKLGVSKSEITNYKLYNFIDAWYATPYKYGGRSHSGVDCSDFVSLLLNNVYNLAISGAVTDLYKQCKPIKATQLKEGDLVFFKIHEKSLSHVGVYLKNHKFVHASVHSGVVIDDLGDDYYKKYFRASGRILK